MTSDLMISDDIKSHENYFYVLRELATEREKGRETEKESETVGRLSD